MEEGNEFTFASDAPAADHRASRHSKPSIKVHGSRPRRNYPVAAPADQNEFSFATAPVTEVASQSAPKSGHYRSDRRSLARDKSAGRSMIPMLIGGIVAIVGFGGGMAMFFMARSEVNPLREQAAAANKKAEDAELRAKTAEAVAAAADARLPEFQRAVEAKNKALKAAEDKSKAATRQLAKLEKEQSDLRAVKPAADKTAMVAAKGGSAPAAPMAAKTSSNGGKN